MLWLCSIYEGIYKHEYLSDRNDKRELEPKFHHQDKFEDKYGFFFWGRRRKFVNTASLRRWEKEVPVLFIYFFTCKDKISDTCNLKEKGFISLLIGCQAERVWWKCVMMRSCSACSIQEAKRREELRTKMQSLKITPPRPTPTRLPILPAHSTRNSLPDILTDECQCLLT